MTETPLSDSFTEEGLTGHESRLTAESQRSPIFPLLLLTGMGPRSRDITEFITPDAVPRHSSAVSVCLGWFVHPFSGSSYRSWPFFFFCSVINSDSYLQKRFDISYRSCPFFPLQSD